MVTSASAPLLPSAARNGFFTGIALILFQTFMYLVDVDMNSNLRYIALVILALSIFLSTKQYRDQLNNGYISYGRSVGYGVLIALFSGIISAAFIYILTRFIDPSIIEKMILASEDYILENIKDEAQAEKAIEMNRMFISPGIFSFGTVINNVIVGLVISLIMSIFLKKENTENQFDKDTL